MFHSIFQLVYALTLNTFFQNFINFFKNKAQRMGKNGANRGLLCYATVPKSMIPQKIRSIFFSAAKVEKQNEPSNVVF